MGLGDLAVASYFSGLDGSDITSASASVSKDLDLLIETAVGRDLVLQTVGASSAALAGGSESAQAQFYTELFAALEPRREAIRFVNVFQLYDFGQEACDQLAIEHGWRTDGPLSALWCSTGLKTALSAELPGQSKPAWQAFLAAASAFSPLTTSL